MSAQKFENKHVKRFNLFLEKLRKTGNLLDVVKTSYKTSTTLILPLAIGEFRQVDDDLYVADAIFLILLPTMKGEFSQIVEGEVVSNDAELYVRLGNNTTLEVDL